MTPVVTSPSPTPATVCRSASRPSARISGCGQISQRARSCKQTGSIRRSDPNTVVIEKEGFDELFEAVQLAERYDLVGPTITLARR